MINRVLAVIGANYGDEGKGLMTDFLSREAGPRAIVVRFNGGAQAGHTVVTPEGKRHVFSHFGSGTLAGLPTFLANPFVCNPVLFMKEWHDLLKATNGEKPVVLVDEACLVTSPFEMTMNQIREKARKKGKHGSCGAGVGETIRRSKANVSNGYTRTPYSLTMGDLYRAVEKDDWTVPIREMDRSAAEMEALCKELTPDVQYDSNAMKAKFTQDCMDMVERTQKSYLYELRRYSQVIFEGAQGLLLDMQYGNFPYVTPSFTGMRRVKEICDSVRLENPHPIYVSRWYLTRHGAGPLDGEIKRPEYLVDETNVRNKFQDHLRYAWLCPQSLADRICTDLRRNRLEGFTPAWTHLDMTDVDYRMPIRTSEGDIIQIRGYFNSYVRDNVDWQGLKWDLHYGASGQTWRNVHYHR